MYYVYLIQSDDELYYGSTNDLRRRLAEHNRRSTGYTSGRSWKLIYYEAFLVEKDARNREHQLKQHGSSLMRLKRRLQHSLNKNRAG